MRVPVPHRLRRAAGAAAGRAPRASRRWRRPAHAAPAARRRQRHRHRRSTRRAAAALAACRPRLRLFVDGEASTRAALIDALFLRCAAPSSRPEGDKGWLPLPRVPLRLAGLADEDAMMPFPARSHPALRLLSEYFCYPEKFNFIDVDPGCWRPAAAALHRFTLHLVLNGMAPDSDAARLLGGLDAQPAARLHPRHQPVPESGRAAAARVHERRLSAAGRRRARGRLRDPQRRRGAPGARRRGRSVTPFAPLYAPGDEGRAGAASTTGSRGATMRRRPSARPRDAHRAGRRRLPPAGRRRRHAVDRPDLHQPRPAVPAAATASRRATCAATSCPRWRRSACCANRAQLALRQRARSALAPDLPPVAEPREPDDGRPGRFQKMLALYDLPRSPGAQRQIAGIVGLEHGTVRAWVGARRSRP
jgi:type VI secretion system protein ImpG